MFVHLNFSGSAKEQVSPPSESWTTQPNLEEVLQQISIQVVLQVPNGGDDAACYADLRDT